MTKKEIYRLRDILWGMRHNKQANTPPAEIHDKFVKLCLCKEGIEICDKSINKMEPLKGAEL